MKKVPSMECTAKKVYYTDSYGCYNVFWSNAITKRYMGNHIGSLWTLELVWSVNVLIPAEFAYDTSIIRDKLSLLTIL